jgi:hypothetical protein
MTDEELLDLALEALEDLQRQYSIYPNSFWDWSKGRKAITAIKQALAAPVQEPVALENVYETIIHWDEGGGKRSRRELARRIVALYTTPPAAQRPDVDAIIAFARADERNRTWTQEHWTDYERNIAAAEREACAKVCDEQVERSLASIEKTKRTTDHRIYRAGAQTATWNAAAIRARGETK